MSSSFFRIQLSVTLRPSLSPSKLPSLHSTSFFQTLKPTNTAQISNPSSILSNYITCAQATGLSGAQVEDHAEVEVSEGFTMTQFCDKMIDLFLNEKPRSKDWRKYLLFRDEWKKYRDSFYNRCQTRADMEAEPLLKEKLSALGRKVKKVKQIMYHLYKTTKNSLRSIAPKEIKLLKHLLNITDPEERFSALATAFSPGGEHEARDPNAFYTAPKELHKWITIMLDAYHLGQEETEIREVKQINEPVVIQRLSLLKETIEEEYLQCGVKTDADANKSGSGLEDF